jgi:MFS family permease
VDLHSSLSGIQWVTSGYLLALALMLPLNGWLVERIGAKSLYLWCFSAFTIPSALCGLAWSANSLIGFRILQGVSGGLMAPMAHSNGISFAGQMLIPIYLIRACSQSPSATGWLLTPLGVGMICTFPWMGALTQRFGIRNVSAGGAFLALSGTLPFLYLASHGLVLTVLACALFVRGIGLSAVGIPSLSAAYASVRKQDLPMATTSLNIVQRLGGPTLTTLCATFLGWSFGMAQSSASLSSAFTAAFLLLCGLHALLFAAALRLPLSLDKATELAEESPALLEMMSE